MSPRNREGGRSGVEENKSDGGPKEKKARKKTGKKPAKRRRSGKKNPSKNRQTAKKSKQKESNKNQSPKKARNIEVPQPSADASKNIMSGSELNALFAASPEASQPEKAAQPAPEPAASQPEQTQEPKQDYSQPTQKARKARAPRSRADMARASQNQSEISPKRSKDTTAQRKPREQRKQERKDRGEFKDYSTMNKEELIAEFKAVSAQGEKASGKEAAALQRQLRALDSHLRTIERSESLTEPQPENSTPPLEQRKQSALPDRPGEASVETQPASIEHTDTTELRAEIDQLERDKESTDQSLKDVKLITEVLNYNFHSQKGRPSSLINWNEQKQRIENIEAGGGGYPEDTSSLSKEEQQDAEDFLAAVKRLYEANILTRQLADVFEDGLDEAYKHAEIRHKEDDGDEPVKFTADDVLKLLDHFENTLEAHSSRVTSHLTRKKESLDAIPADPSRITQQIEGLQAMMAETVTLPGISSDQPAETRNLRGLGRQEIEETLDLYGTTATWEGFSRELSGDEAATIIESSGELDPEHEASEQFYDSSLHFERMQTIQDRIDELFDDADAAREQGAAGLAQELESRAEWAHIELRNARRDYYQSLFGEYRQKYLELAENNPDAVFDNPEIVQLSEELEGHIDDIIDSAFERFEQFDRMYDLLLEREKIAEVDYLLAELTVDQDGVNVLSAEPFKSHISAKTQASYLGLFALANELVHRRTGERSEDIPDEITQEISQDMIDEKLAEMGLSDEEIELARDAGLELSLQERETLDKTIEQLQADRTRDEQLLNETVDGIGDITFIIDAFEKAHKGSTFELSTDSALSAISRLESSNEITSSLAETLRAAVPQLQSAASRGERATILPEEDLAELSKTLNHLRDLNDEYLTRIIEANSSILLNEQIRNNARVVE